VHSCPHGYVFTTLALSTSPRKDVLTRRRHDVHKVIGFRATRTVAHSRCSISNVWNRWVVVSFTVDVQQKLDISEMFYFEAARWTRRLAVKLVVEDVLFQLFETDHFGEKMSPFWALKTAEDYWDCQLCRLRSIDRSAFYFKWIGLKVWNSFPPCYPKLFLFRIFAIRAVRLRKLVDFYLNSAWNDSDSFSEIIEKFCCIIITFVGIFLTILDILN